MKPVPSVSRGNRGKRFRNELNLALRMLRSWRYCFDNTGHVRGPKRPGDLMGTWCGFSVLLEAKETRSDLLDFSRLEEHQGAHLGLQARSGGLAFVAIRWCLPQRPRAFLVPIETWEDLRGSLGRKSLPLRDSLRPEGVLELSRGRVRDDVEQGCLNELVWDLRPALDRHVRHRLARLRASRPDLFSEVEA